MPRINSKQVEMACLGTVHKRTDGIIEEWRVQIASARSRSRRRSRLLRLSNRIKVIFENMRSGSIELHWPSAPISFYSIEWRSVHNQYWLWTLRHSPQRCNTLTKHMLCECIAPLR